MLSDDFTALELLEDALFMNILLKMASELDV